MSELSVLLPSATTGVLLVAGAVPSPWADRQVRAFRRGVSGVAGLQALFAVFALIAWLGSRSASHATPAAGHLAEPFTGLVYLDGISTLMLLLVSFIGWVIGRYSLRHLDGDPRQGRYYRWIALTLGAVSLLVVAGNLLVLMLGWSLMSLGIHHLLLHNPERRTAHRAAWTKFGFSRVGDLCLLAALVLVYRTFGTFQLGDLFVAVELLPEAGAQQQSLSLIAWLFVLGSAIKSAQFPWHAWLPDTMEAPTPVSALMHAGIVNAGGYFLIRMSPLLTSTPLALATLACLGAVTACFGALVMLTQNSVKRSLAYSTVSQMGFMMLQCGLGAFSAALLHIVAHSLYKAHAFLSSGSVLTQAASTRTVAAEFPVVERKGGVLAAAALIPLAIYAGVALAFDLDPSRKPGGYLLGFILCLGMTRWMNHAMQSGRGAVMAASTIVTGVLATAYVVSFLAVDRVVIADSTPVTAPVLPWVIAAFVAGTFSLLYLLESFANRRTPPRWLETLYVHAINGFYVDTLIRRVVRAGNV